MKLFRKHFILIFGLIWIAVGIFVMTLSAGANDRCTQTVTATIKEYRLDDSYNGDTGTTSTAYYPVVEYVAEGMHVEAVSNTGSSKRPYSVGDRVEVRYNPDDVYEFVFEGDKSGTRIFILAIGVGVICVVLDILEARGVVKTVKRGRVNSRYRNSPVYSRNGGISLDLGNIKEAAMIAQKLKEAGKQFKDLSPEERQALIEMLNGEGIEEDDEE